MGTSYLPEPNTNKHSVNGESSRLTFGATEMQGWRVSMEDRLLVVPSLESSKESSLFAVFDGHGGSEVAEFVKRHFAKELVKAPGYKSGNLKKALVETYLKMDRLLGLETGKRELKLLTKSCKVAKSSTANPDSKIAHNAGCTATVALIKGDTLYIANAGDSRAILITKEGNAIELTKDHKPNIKAENERIRKAGGIVVNGRVDGDLNISRAIGDLLYKSNKLLKREEQIITAYPDIASQHLEAGIEYAFLATDGVFSVKSSQEVASFIAKHRKANPKALLTETTEKLLDAIISPNYVKTAGIGGDNMSCILIKTH